MRKWMALMTLDAGIDGREENVSWWKAEKPE